MTFHKDTLTLIVSFREKSIMYVIIHTSYDLFHFSSNKIKRHRNTASYEGGEKYCYKCYNMTLIVLM